MAGPNQNKSDSQKPPEKKIGDSEPPPSSRRRDPFWAEYHKSLGSHLALVQDFVLHRTDVDDVLSDVEGAERRSLTKPPYPIIKGQLGDPVRYPNIRAFSGYERHLRRLLSFPEVEERMGSVHAYLPAGYEPLKKTIELGTPLHTVKTATQSKVVPHGVQAWITDGVSGALRNLCQAWLLPNLKLDSSDKRINAILPLWSYSCHYTEVLLAHGETKPWFLDESDPRKSDQLDLDHLKRSINQNTRMVIFATVGNPLSVGMHPTVFRDVLRIVSEKMEEYNHGIIVVADTIYEPLRRNPENSIDPIQISQQENLGVPVADVCSFSKVMGIPGHRIGYARIQWEEDSFPLERHDFLHSMDSVYKPLLNPANSLAQIAIGNLFESRNHCIDEDVAPIAAILTAIKELGSDERYKQGDSAPPEKQGKPEKKSGLGRFLFSEEEVDSKIRQLGVEGFYSIGAIASRVRRIAQTDLTRYNVPIRSDGIVHEFAMRLHHAGFLDVREAAGHTWFRLKEGVHVPDIPRKEDGELRLYEIAKIQKGRWGEIAKQCEIKTEGEVYDEHLKYLRDITYERMDYFVRGLQKIDGIYLHPAYGNPVDLDRINNFIVMFGLEALRPPENQRFEISQAAQLASICVANRLPIIVGTPGEQFLPPNFRGSRDYSYIRMIALHDKEQTDLMLDTLERIVRFHV